MKTKILFNPNAPKETRQKARTAANNVMGRRDNKYKVPLKLWREFSDAAKKVFNDVMDESLKNQELTVHPNTQLPKAEWHTICHNFACYAAWAVDSDKLEKGTVVIDMKGGKEVARRKVK